MTISKLDPKRLWKHFEDLCAIPRGSGNEKGVIAHLLKFAEEMKLPVRTDRVGNVVITKPAAQGVTGPGIVLQAHMDMVCEKNSDTVHDFEKDPIRPVISGEVVKATGTSLGADNGIGMAAAMALLEEDLPLPEIEVLFTVDEETGLVGAGALTPESVKNRILLNLDSEEEGLFYIGCAGGQDAQYSLAVERQERQGQLYRLSLAGLAGGHSGCDINRNRGNALAILGNLLQSLLKACDIRLCRVCGGSKRNAIPRESCALISMDPSRAEAAEKGVAELAAIIATTLPSEDSAFKVTLAPWSQEKDGSKGLCDTSADLAALVPMTLESTRSCLGLLAGIPTGVIAMSNAMEGLVETSNNLALASCTAASLDLVSSGRSSVAGSLKALGLRLDAVGESLGAKVKRGDGYPGWRPNPDSPLIGAARQAYSELYGKTPEITAIHAGLECGLIGEAIPGMQMISFGPTIRNPHSPDEFVDIASVGKFYEFIRKLCVQIGSQGLA